MILDWGHSVGKGSRVVALAVTVLA